MIEEEQAVDRYTRGHWKIHLPYDLYSYYSGHQSYYDDIIKAARNPDPEKFDEAFKKKKIAQKAATKERARKKQKEKTKVRQAVTFNMNDQTDVANKVMRIFAAKLREQIKTSTQKNSIVDEYATFNVTISLRWKKEIPRILTRTRSIGARNLDRSGKELHEAIKKLPYYDEIMDQLLHAEYGDVYKRFAINFIEGGTTIGMLDKSESIRYAAKKLEEKKEEASNE